MADTPRHRRRDCLIAGRRRPRLRRGRRCGVGVPSTTYEPIGRTLQTSEPSDRSGTPIARKSARANVVENPVAVRARTLTSVRSPRPPPPFVLPPLPDDRRARRYRVEPLTIDLIEGSLADLGRGDRRDSQLRRQLPLARMRRVGRSVARGGARLRDDEGAAVATSDAGRRARDHGGRPAGEVSVPRDHDRPGPEPDDDPGPPADRLPQGGPYGARARLRERRDAAARGGRRADLTDALGRRLRSCRAHGPEPGTAAPPVALRPARALRHRRPGVRRRARAAAARPAVVDHRRRHVAFPREDARELLRMWRGLRRTPTGASRSRPSSRRQSSGEGRGTTSRALADRAPHVRQWAAGPTIR